MTDQFPSIVPSAELRCQWQSESPFRVISVEREDYMIDRAAQWGSDQELEATLKEVSYYGCTAIADLVRAERRPKTPSMKEQALAKLVALEIDEPGYEGTYDTIRRALEALPDNEH